MEDKIVRAARASEKQDLARQMRRQMTPAEDALWQRLRRSQLRGLHFRRQQVIDGFVADFYCREARLVIECDGQVHERQAEYDRERDRILATHNLQVLRFTNAQLLSDIEAVLDAIALTAREQLREKYQP
jgi:very-short-patch-repair endonuclease